MSNNETFFHVVRRLGQAEAAVGANIPKGVWMFAIYKRVDTPLRRYSDDNGEMIALMHSAIEADIVARSLNATRAHTRALMEPCEPQAPAQPAVSKEAQRFISDCPAGYDTILGYLAKHHPTRLEILDEEPEATQRDGWWCVHRCRERGLPLKKVGAPPFLWERDIYEVNAYPVELLKERLD